MWTCDGALFEEGVFSAMSGKIVAFVGFDSPVNEIFRHNSCKWTKGVIPADPILGERGEAPPADRSPLKASGLQRAQRGMRQYFRRHHS